MNTVGLVVSPVEKVAPAPRDTRIHVACGYMNVLYIHTPRHDSSRDVAVVRIAWSERCVRYGEQRM